MATSKPAGLKSLPWLGARNAAVSAVLGILLFVVLNFAPFGFVNAPGDIGFVVFLAVLGSLFALPFVFIGGYGLGWLVQKRQWRTPDRSKAVVSGMVLAALTLLVIFGVGGVFQACLMSHGYCAVNFVLFMRNVLAELQQGFANPATRALMERFLLALPIAMACGGFTAWQLSRAAAHVLAG